VKVVALAGGVGGAKLADGLARCLPPHNLTVVVNTGDDFDHFGLHICPDLDTVCYTLAGLANPETGWGLADENWSVSQAIEFLGGPTWFHLGDRDLATHLERTRRLQAGDRLNVITRDFCRAWGIGVTVLPATDDHLRTIVLTAAGDALPFQEYFVHRKCQPPVKGFRFDGIEQAQPAEGVMQAIQDADVVVVCPSNPWVSIDPILKITGVEEALSSCIVVAVSPLIGGRAVKGPAAKMCSELGIEPSARAVADHYRSFLTGFMLDHADRAQADEIGRWGIISNVTNILMSTIQDRARLAGELLQMSEQITRKKKNL
jgi:LPPG:FO 2-phospho-L-lactate transferase